MKHVLVESNWVFEYVEPEFKRKPSARRLVVRAVAGELALHVPAICLREGAESVRRKCQPRHELGIYRRFAKQSGSLDAADSEVVQRFLDAFDEHVKADLASIDGRLDELLKIQGVSESGSDFVRVPVSVSVSSPSQPPLVLAGALDPLMLLPSMANSKVREQLLAPTKFIVPASRPPVTVTDEGAMSPSP